MLAGLAIYLAGQDYLPDEAPRSAPPGSACAMAGTPAPPRGLDRRTLLVLLGIGLAVTVFRAAYEQVGNTVALWADSGIDRQAGGWLIPMTWFQSLNPLFVMLMTPPLLAYWGRRAARGHDQPAARRMAQGALIVAGAYLLLACLSWSAGGERTGWMWLALFFALFTFGELFILPTGLGLFARLAPSHMGATTVGAWFLITFSGSLCAGLAGSLWSRLGPTAFFLLLAALAAASAAMLWRLNAALASIDGAPGGANG